MVETLAPYKYCLQHTVYHLNIENFLLIAIIAIIVTAVWLA